MCGSYVRFHLLSLENCNYWSHYMKFRNMNIYLGYTDFSTKQTFVENISFISKHHQGLHCTLHFSQFQGGKQNSNFQTLDSNKMRSYTSCIDTNVRNRKNCIYVSVISWHSVIEILPYIYIYIFFFCLLDRWSEFLDTWWCFEMNENALKTVNWFLSEV